MKIQKNRILFEASDAHFVEKFGAQAAAEMVLDFRSLNNLPFLYDTWQLADFLHTSRKSLFYYARHAGRSYTTREIPKHSGGVRHLQVPCRQLRGFQNIILREILSRMPISPYATAYRKGGHIIENAVPHVGKRYLLKLDLRDFFDSITFDQVYRAAFHTGNFPVQIGLMLAEDCCRKGCLPQGAPTSPALSNLVLRHFDTQLGCWCRDRGVAYTRYCDDMTFSADRPLYDVYGKVRRMLDKEGFTLNEAKTRFITNAGRQSVTGLTVNEKVAVAAPYKRQLRQEIYYALKFGAAESILRGGHEEYVEDGVPKEERYLLHLLGRTQYILQIEPENRWFGDAKVKLLERIR